MVALAFFGFVVVFGQRIVDADVNPVLALDDADADFARAVRRFYAVVHRVFQQRLQQQVWHFGLLGRIHIPHRLQALVAHAYGFNRQIALCQFDFTLQCAGLVAIFELGAKQIGQVFQHHFRFGRARAHQGNGGIEAVEQKMRADARGQGGEFGFAQCWRQCALQNRMVVHEAPHIHRHQHHVGKPCFGGKLKQHRTKQVRGHAYQPRQHRAVRVVQQKAYAQQQ